MKTFLIILSTILFLAIFEGCSSEDPKPIIEKIVRDTNTVTVSTGSFVSKVHQTSGTATILKKDSVISLAIENFKTDSGPDLRVYLSASEGVADYVELGTLKSTSGTFSYAVLKTVDTKKYKYVLIWCEDFSVLFGVAELK